MLEADDVWLSWSAVEAVDADDKSELRSDWILLDDDLDWLDVVEELFELMLDELAD